MTHYEVLGVAADASPDDVRRAYVGLARRHHPDYYAAAGEPARKAAEQRMQAVNEAWAVLGHTGRRAAYDRSLASAGAGAGGDRGFRPFETGEDDVDPRTAVDEPYRREAPRVLARQRTAAFVPVVLFAAAVALSGLGLVVGAVPLLALAAIAFVLSCAGFVVVPLVVMARAARDEG